jgi:hypothetical protein
VVTRLLAALFVVLATAGPAAAADDVTPRPAPVAATQGPAGIAPLAEDPEPTATGTERAAESPTGHWQPKGWMLLAAVGGIVGVLFVHRVSRGF